MPQKKNGGQDENGDILSVSDYVKLVEKVRKSTNDVLVNICFDRIVKEMKPRIKNLCRKFRIPGLGEDDVYQEALYALRYKAIKDYNKDRGSGEGLAPFDRFAMLCIRRHLATELKTSQQVKNQAMVKSVSLTQERNDGEDDLSLINVIPHGKGKGNVLSSVEKREYHRKLVSKLLSKLSSFEQEVFRLYVDNYSYEQMAEIINRRRATGKTNVNIKGVDNAISRIKNKGEAVFDKYGDKEMRIRDATKQKLANSKRKSPQPDQSAVNAQSVDNAIHRIVQKAINIIEE